MAGNTVQKRQNSGVKTVDPRDEPSAEWGWHGSFPKATRIAGWFTTIVMFLLMINNHENNTENVWLIGTGLGLIVLLLIDHRRSRNAWRR